MDTRYTESLFRQLVLISNSCISVVDLLEIIVAKFLAVFQVEKLLLDTSVIVTVFSLHTNQYQINIAMFNIIFLQLNGTPSSHGALVFARAFVLEFRSFLGTFLY